MTSSYLLWNILLGVLGLGLLSYAKVRKRVIPLISGIFLLVLPYLTSNEYYFALATFLALFGTIYLTY